MAEAIVDRTAGIAGYHARRVRRLGVSDDVRTVRVVHTLDGLEGDVEPQTVMTTGRELWRQWQADARFRQHDVIVGLDAGGILPAVAMALASGTPYRLAWKLDLDMPAKRMFREPHARRSEVFIYGSVAGRRLLLVDDEVTTGRTMANIIAVLRDGGADVVGVTCLVEDTQGSGRERLDAVGVALCALRSL